MLNLLKAADIHRTRSTDREYLKCIRIHTTPAGFAIAATDSHTLFRAECEPDQWEFLQYTIREERATEIPNTPTNGLFHLDDKARKACGITRGIWTADTDLAPGTFGYPDYERVIPDPKDGGETMNDPGLYPMLAFETYAKIQKTLKSLGIKAPFWRPQYWAFSGKYGASWRYYDDVAKAKRVTLLAMPMRDLDNDWYQPTGVQRC